MLEKIKEKGKKIKQWAVEHKTDLAYFGGCIVGAAITCAVYKHDDKKAMTETRKRYPGETGVLSMRKYADYIDYTYGTDLGTVDKLSDRLIENGAVKDAKVIGALVYTKKQ